MTPYANNFSVLPFYTNAAQLQHKRSYSYGDKYALYSYNSKILPFQIKRPTSIAPIVSCVLKPEGGDALDITAEMLAAGLNIQAFSGYDLIVNPSAMIFPELQLVEGRHTLEISDGVTTWHSDIFTVRNDTSKLVKLLFWDSQNLEHAHGQISYAYPFKNYILLDTEIGKPEYKFEEEVSRRDGYLFYEKQISYKLFKFAFLAPEYLCDVLRLVRMHDYIKIIDKNANYSIESIIFDTNWQDQGNLAAVSAEFECDTVVKKIGRGLPISPLGGFSNDFSDDFDNQ
jgi:hypothetical protein